MSTKVLQLFVLGIVFCLSTTSKCYRRYVLTGGPGVGKSTIIAELASRGYLTVPETCSAFCERASQNKTLDIFFEDPLAFQTALLVEQLKSESLLPDSKPAFLDRSTVDIIAYGDYFNVPMPESLRKQAHCNYDLIFIIDPLPTSHYKKTHLRKESAEESACIHAILKDAYRQAGYAEHRIISVPFDTPTARANYILNVIDIHFGIPAISSTLVS